MAEIRVLQQIHVSPPPSLPSQTPQTLSYFDTVWLHGARVERLFFYDYPHPISHFIDNHLHSFTESLILTLLHFHPIAGTIRRSPISDHKFQISYTKGDSISITIAEFIGEHFNNISGNHLRDLNTLRLLVPNNPPNSSLDGEKQKPPISIQITIFANQGLCIGFNLNHAVCDGTGSMQFIRSWAAACRSANGNLNISPPFLDRSIIVDNRGLDRKLNDIAKKIHDIYPEKLKQQATLNNKSLTTTIFSGTYTISKLQIAKLKKLVQMKAVELGFPPFHLSTFVVTCAYVLRSLVKAYGYDDNRDIGFSCAVDWRQRMNPPIPTNYFGNCVGPCSTGLIKAGKIAGKDGFEIAAMEIGRSIDELKGKDVELLLETAIDRFIDRAEDTPPLSVAGSPKLRVYETDFGWGSPRKVEVTSIGDTGAMSVAESAVEEGGVEIGLALPEEVMVEFGKHFAGCLLDVF